MKRILGSIFILLFCMSVIGCGHQHTMEEMVVVKPTCNSNGSVKHYCTKCDYNYIKEIKSQGHIYDEGHVVIEATCTTAGRKEYICTVCGEKKKEIIPQKHNFTETVTKEATCSKNGTKILTCSLCGRREAQEIQSTGHSFIDNTCKECGAYRVKDLTADHWYNYAPLNIVNVQNCLVADAYVRVSGNVAVNYCPVCKYCHIAGPTSMAFVDEYDSFMKTYRCDCGEETTILIKIAF